MRVLLPGFRCAKAEARTDIHERPAWLAGVLIGALLIASLARAAAVLPTLDKAGSRDPAMLKRYEGALILSAAIDEFVEFTLPEGPLQAVPGRKDAKANQYFEPAKKLVLEGRRTRLVYLAPDGRSPLEVSRNYRQELSNAGGEILFECSGEECGGNATRSSDGSDERMSLAMVLQPVNRIEDAFGSAARCAQTTRIAEQRYLATSLPEKNAHISVLTYTVMNPNAGATCSALNRRTIAVVDVIESKAMEQKMVTVSAREIAGSISASGSIALYGILFDFNQAVVKPESEATLAEIAKYLSSEPSINVLVVGHTDNVGNYVFNLDLSSRRATAVVEALSSRYAIARERMKPIGASFSNPVASNHTDEGRAKNRRVALVDAH